MKPIIRKAAILAFIPVILLATSMATNAQTLVYKKDINPSIGITVENATGATYTVKNKNGNTVLQGKVKSNKAFYVSTRKLNAGEYRFCIGNMVVQQFTLA